MKSKMSLEYKEILKEYAKIKEECFDDFSEIFYRAHFRSSTLDCIERLNRILKRCRELEYRTCVELATYTENKDIRTKIEHLGALRNVTQVRVLRSIVISLSVVATQGQDILRLLYKER